MMKKLIVVIMILFVVFFENCKKDNTTYSYCTGCPVEAWAGNYSGTGTYYTSNTGETIPDVVVEVNIGNPGGNNLKVNVTAPDHVSFQFFGTKNNDEPYFSLAGTTSSLDLTLYQKGNEYKINGTAKTYQTIRDSVMVNKALTFRVFKKAN